MPTSTTIDLTPEPGSDRQTFSIREAAEFSGWSRKRISRLIQGGHLDAPLIGTRRCVNLPALIGLMRCVAAEEGAAAAVRDAIVSPVPLLRLANSIQTDLTAARRKRRAE